MPGLASILYYDPMSDDNAGERSLEFSHFMGIAFWAIYQAIVVILLINILIAMMNTTFSKVYEDADCQWKYSKSYYQVQFLAPRAVLPPPFRIFYYFAKFIRYLKTQNYWPQCSCGDAAIEYEREDREEKRKEYLNLLFKLVQTKQHSDVEHSVEDNFKDLRQDIQNMISDKQKYVNSEMDDLKMMILKLSAEVNSLKNQKLASNQTKISKISESDS